MQNEEKQTVCQLCLTSGESTFKCIEALTIGMLRFLGIGVDLDVSGRPVICIICSDKLQKCFDFKTICLCTEDCINSFIDDRNNTYLSLWEIYLRKYENEDIALSNCHTVCRLCMEIAEADCYIRLNDEAKDLMSAKTILDRYISEIDLDIIKNPVICISCNESLYSYFDFVKDSLDMTNKVKKECKVEESRNRHQDESKSVLQFASENISNYENGYADLNMLKNCDENELHGGIKLEFGNLAQREFQQWHSKVTEPENDGVKVEKLDDVFEKYDENGENCETELMSENSVKTENDGINIKHEEIDVKSDEGDTARFEMNILIHTNDSDVTTFSCELCTYKAKLKSNLKRHTLIHKNSSEVTMYSCEICTYKAKRKGDLKEHMLTHKNFSEVTVYSCEVCTYKSKQKSGLKTHMLIHKNSSEVTMHSCKICTYKSKHKSNLKQHMLIHKSTSDITMYSCEICMYKAKQKGALKQHMLIHKNTCEVTTYSCKICTFKSRRKSSLKQHMLIHKSASEVTMYSCEICTYKSKKKSYLKTHMLIHNNTSEVTMYSCDICTYKAKTRSNLKQHMLIHKSTSELTMYPCELCPYKAKLNSVLTRHMLIHKNVSEVRMYSCEMCAYKAKRKSHVKRHMLTHKNGTKGQS